MVYYLFSLFNSPWCIRHMSKCDIQFHRSLCPYPVENPSSASGLQGYSWRSYPSSLISPGGILHSENVKMFVLQLTTLIKM